MIMQDKLEKERNDAKNAVEEYVYEFRDKLSGPYEKFVCEKVGYSFSTFSVNTDTKYLFCIPWSSFLICLSWKQLEILIPLNNAGADLELGSGLANSVYP